MISGLGTKKLLSMGFEILGLVFMKISEKVKLNRKKYSERIIMSFKQRKIKFKPRKKLKHNMWYCVYYLHTETLIILAGFLFQIFPKC